MSDSELLLLDEPFAGVNPTLEKHIVGHVVSPNQEGSTVLVIEHELEHFVEIVDRLMMLHGGRILVEGDPDAVLSNDQVNDAYLGDSLVEG